MVGGPFRTGTKFKGTDINSTVTEASVLSILEDEVLNGDKGIEARSAESGAAPAGEAPCCP